MSTPDRHLSTLEWVIERAGLDRADVIGSSVVAGPSKARVTAARRRARKELASARSRRDQLSRSLGRLRRDRADVAADAAEAEQAASEATERRHRLEAAADAALGRLAQLDARLTELSAEIEQASARESSVDALLAAVQEQIGRLARAAVSPAEREDLAVHLEGWARAASALGLCATADALASWSRDLSAGTADLQPRAAALLDELSEVRAQWQEHGAGDLSCAPAVVAARAELSAARQLLHEVEVEAKSGGLGQRARASIETAHRHRLALEAKGRKADPNELLQALEAETAALRQVGFDSILDYRIAMSTGGSGVLVDACRRSAEARVSQLESSLEEVERDTSAAQAQLGGRLDGLLREAEELTGAAGEAPIEQALRGCLATPCSVRTAVTEIQAFAATTRELLERSRTAIDTLQHERRTVERERSQALADAVDLLEKIEDAERAHLRASSKLTEIDRALTDSVNRLGEADDAVVAAEGELERVLRRRYLKEDVRSFGEALIAAVAARSRSMGEGGPRPVVIDDPLGGFDDDDAVAVLDDLIAHDWSAPVLFVTSRAKLISRLRRPRGQVRGIDGRRRDPSRRRWRRRQARAGALA